MPSPSYSTTPPPVSENSIEGDANYTAPSFPIGPFTKSTANPILVPNPENDFESAYIYNSAAIVLDNLVFLLYRAQNAAKVSTLGLAWSEDGEHFTRLSRPVMTPTETWEQGGGVEDPRLVRFGGVVYMTYTAYDTQQARLCLATSTDLVNWKKYPPLYPGWVEVETTMTGRHLIRRDWTKAASIFPEVSADGKYTMLWGEACIYQAESEDLINWHTRPYNQYFAAGIHVWENRLLEPGPSPIKTKDGNWILFYNAASQGGQGYAGNQYSVGQMLIDRENLGDGPLARLEKPCIAVDQTNEEIGQVNRVVFCEGLVQFKGKWLLYFGQGDSELGVAVADAI